MANPTKVKKRVMNNNCLRLCAKLITKLNHWPHNTCSYQDHSFFSIRFGQNCALYISVVVTSSPPNIYI